MAISDSDNSTLADFRLRPFVVFFCHRPFRRLLLSVSSAGVSSVFVGWLVILIRRFFPLARLIRLKAGNTASGLAGAVSKADFCQLQARDLRLVQFIAGGNLPPIEKPL